MKVLHKPNLFCWSEFNEERNLDFHSYLWVREGGNIIIDPLPLSAHDEKHLVSLGGASRVVITNSDHIRDAETIARKTRAKILGPEGEKKTFPIKCDKWLKDGDKVVSGLDVYSLNGSKTPGELVLLIEGDTLITGDLVRAHQGGRLCLLPDMKLKDKKAAVESVKKLTNIKTIKAVLPGDGWPVFGDGHKALQELFASLG